MISVVVPVRNEAQTLAPTVERLLETLPPRSEVVVVDDGSTDRSADELSRFGADCRLLRSEGGLGVAGARNWGAAAARGDAIAFCDAHVWVGDGVWDGLRAALDEPQVGAVAPGIGSFRFPARRGFGMTVSLPDICSVWLLRRPRHPHPVPQLGGAFLMTRRDVLERTGAFDEGMLGWGFEDVEFGLRLWLLGYELRVVPDVEVLHQFRSAPPYPPDPTRTLHNRLRLTLGHLSGHRLALAMDTLRRTAGFDRAYALCASGDIWRRRSALFARRLRSDAWYFDALCRRSATSERSGYG